MTFIPQSIRIGSQWVKFENVTEKQLVGFAQEVALDGMMKGTPFGEVIKSAVETAIMWTKVVK